MRVKRRMLLSGHLQVLSEHRRRLFAGVRAVNRVSDRAPVLPLPYPPGTVLAGKYRVERLLGEGGMGWVVLAVHEQLEQRVALKFLRESHAAGRPEAVGRFLREARAAARIESEHVARVTDVGTLEGGAPYLVMEYLQGQDLDGFLAVRAPLPTKLAVDYAMQACESLAEAHAVGIVHRDLKPVNLFSSPAARTGRCA